MFIKKIADLSIDDINQLIRDSAKEGKSLEFKKILPNDSDSDKKEFLADVSSFANTIGGHLIYGVEENNGLAKAISLIESDNFDGEILRLENIIQSGIDPRIKTELVFIDSDDPRKKILVIHVSKSWLSPHRVVYKNWNKFFARNSAGKYELDVTELRTSFNLNNTIVDKVVNFKNDRIMKLVANEAPINFKNGTKIVMHFIPFESFNPDTQFDLEFYHSKPGELPPMFSRGWNTRRNLNGFLSYSGYADKDNSDTYTQIYRNGIIEVVNGSIIERERGEKPIIPRIAYEFEILKYFKQCMGVIKKLGIGFPIMFSLSFLDVRGFSISDSIHILDDIYPIDQDNLILPETVIEGLGERAEDILRPMFNLVWNACGLKESKNFDSENNWIAK
jgi:hypothetical protein